MSNIKKIDDARSKTIVEWFMRNEMKQDTRQLTHGNTAGDDRGATCSSLAPRSEYIGYTPSGPVRGDDRDENATTLLALVAVIMVFAAVMLGLLLRAVEAAASYQGVL
jgi:hypothetical protein